MAHMHDVFLIFLRLGLTSFGGPVAHLGYFHNEFVLRRKWLDAAAYADLVALCQFLPGPASSQAGMALGLMRAGYGGALAAWAGFTLPSALLMAAFAQAVAQGALDTQSGWLHGLKVAAVAVVAQAVWGMGRKLTPDAPRLLLALAVAAFCLAFPFAGAQVAAIAAGGAFGLFFLPRAPPAASAALPCPVGRKTALACLAAFAVLLAALPLLAAATGAAPLQVFDSFYRAGALVFGGGHVVLPLLQSAVVTPGWMSQEAFMAGYGAAQAVPGPLFTFAAYLGAGLTQPPNGAAGAALCTLAIFLPSFLLVVGALPFWAQLRHAPRLQAGLRGVNAAVVGLLAAAFCHPVLTSGILDWRDAVLALVAFALLEKGRAPSWLVVGLCAFAGGLL